MLHHWWCIIDDKDDFWQVTDLLSARGIWEKLIDLAIVSLSRRTTHTKQDLYNEAVHNFIFSCSPQYVPCSQNVQNHKLIHNWVSKPQFTLKCIKMLQYLQTHLPISQWSNERAFYLASCFSCVFSQVSITGDLDESGPLSSKRNKPQSPLQSMLKTNDSSAISLALPSSYPSSLSKPSTVTWRRR